MCIRDRLNTAENFYDGAPTSLLGIVPVSDKPFGSAVSLHFEHPHFKKLTNGTISELEIYVTDENNQMINNHDLPINIVLEIKY